MSGRRDRSRQGFTLIELLAVIGIIVVLMGIVMAGASYGQRAADRSRARSQIEVISMALDRYNSSFTRYPTNFTVNVGAKPGVFSNLVIFAADLLNMRLQTNTTRSPQYIEIL
ncbi:MAG: prepilin-type N-terminal cleavage/methylation domain-containing protein, partial [Verrucomicrobia bacterium]|nr:prepilin-type N-terminal cleavage/methylation domain-containing protein [Verrucomicrobiota bacterium]